MNKITIIKGINKETGKNEIQRVVIFSDNAPVDFQEYERERHLLLIANFLNDHDIDILDDGLRRAMEEGLISIVNFDDEIAMEAFRNDVVEANLLASGDAKKEEVEEEKEAEETEEKEEERPRKKLNIGEEMEDLARYFRLSHLRDAGVLNPKAKEELDEIVARCERAAAIETARNEMLADNAKEEDYQRVYAEQRAALSEAIKNANTVEVEEKAKVKKLELSPEFSDLARYFRLSILRNNGQLPPKGIEELNEIVARNERAAAIEETRNQMLAGNRVTEKGYQQVYDVHRKALADEIKRVAALNVGNAPIAAAMEDEKVVLPIEEANTDEFEFDNNKNEFDFSDNSFQNDFNTEDFNSFDNNKNEVEYKDNSNFVSFNEDDDKNVKEEVEEVIEDEAKEEAKEEPAQEIEPNNDKKGFVILDNEEAKEEKDEEDKVEGKVLPPIVIPKQDKEEIKGLDDEEKEPVPGLIVHPNPPKGHEEVKGIIPDGRDDPENTEEIFKTEDGTDVKVKKHNRALAGLIGFLLSLPIIGGIVYYFVNKDKKEVPSDNKGSSTQDDTSRQENVTMNATLSYCSEMNLPQTTAAFLCRGDVQAFLEGFKNPEQRKEVLSALAFGFEMNALTTKDGNLRTSADGSNILKSYCYDYMCAKAFVNNYTPEQMAIAFGDADMTYEKLIQGYEGFFNMMEIYGIYGTEMPPFRYLFNGETKDCKALSELFSSLAVVNAGRKSGVLYSSQTDDFIVTVDRLYGRGTGLQFSNEGAASLGMSLVLAYTRGQANVAYGEALILQEDHGASKKGLSLAPDEDGHWEIDGFNYTDLFTQANRAWGSEPDYNSRCWQYQQSMYNAVEEARKIAKGNSEESNIVFAGKINAYDELKDYAAKILDGSIQKSEMNELYLKITDKYPHLATEAANYLASQSASNAAKNLRSINEYAPQVDAFFGLGLKDENEYNNVMAYYINKVRAEAQNVKFYGPDGKLITGKPYGPTGPSGPSRPSVPAPETHTTTTEERVEWEDLTPEEQHQAEEQIHEMQEQEEQEHQEQIQHAEEVAQDITDQLHDGQITQEEAEAALEAEGIDVWQGDEETPSYADQMEQIRQDEEAAAAAAQAAADEANRQEQERIQREEEQRRIEEQKQREEEEALINGQNPPNVEEPAAPAEEPAPVEPAPEAPTVVEGGDYTDPELDPTGGLDDETPYTGNEKTIRDLQDLRAMALELGDFGMDNPGRSYTL